MDTLQLVLGERWPHTTRLSTDFADDDSTNATTTAATGESDDGGSDDGRGSSNQTAGATHGVSGGVGELGALVGSMVAMRDRYENEKEQARTLPQS